MINQKDYEEAWAKYLEHLKIMETTDLEIGCAQYSFAKGWEIAEQTMIKRVKE
jgi:hypothetical protein